MEEDLECIKEVFIQQIEILVDNPQKNFDKIIELTKLLQFENRLITSNTEGTEDLFWEGSQRLEIEFKDLVEQLVQVTDENLLLLMDFHDEFEAEHVESDFRGSVADFGAGEVVDQLEFADVAVVGSGESDVDEADGFLGCSAGGSGDAGVG